MYVLGISETDNDAGVVLLDGPEVVAAANEERFSRTKLHRGFPYRALAWVLEYAGVSLDQVDHIGIAKADPSVNPNRFYRTEAKLRSYPYFNSLDSAPLPFKAVNFAVNTFRNVPRANALAKEMAGEILAWCKSHNCDGKALRLPHHYAHAACAYWASGFEDALAVTIDGAGEGTTSEIYRVSDGNFELIKEITLPSSLGNFYAAITRALGFKPSRHEGKITGLAAYATPDAELLAAVREIAYNDAEGSFAAPCVYGYYPRILYLCRKYSREQMAAAFQVVLEEVATRYIAYYVQSTGMRNIVLAGGVFGNVKLNQRIHEIAGVENVFVFPHMGDGGLGYGAAQMVFRGKTGSRAIAPIRDVYWGPDYSRLDIEQELERYNVAFVSCEDIEREVATLLAQGKVVAHFNGRMEFGPRALGNRSILYSTTDQTVNDWLNKRLNRTEFMPFAPITIADEAKHCYLNLSGAEFTSQFMTITFDCTDRMKNESPAVVHVDGTARPQLVNREINPRCYRILRHYQELTGIPSLVNTSFNMHEEPIVCTPADAIRAFLDGHLDYLAIGDFLVGARNQ